MTTDLSGFTARASRAILEAESIVVWILEKWNRARVAGIIASLRRIEEAYPR